MTGRNDPCPCGSGKKYKQCCLLKEMQEEADRRQEMASPKESPSTAPDAEVDPLITRMDNWWETFAAASYEEKWELVDAALRDEPELMDREMVFEVGNALFDQIVARGEFERFERLLDSFKEKAPEAYQHEVTYILEWRFESALARKAWPAVEEVFVEFSKIASRDLDVYYGLVAALAYYGRLKILLQGMRRALPIVKAADNLVEWAAGEFAENLSAYELLYLLQENPELTSDDPNLRQYLADFAVTAVPARLEEILDYRSGRKQPAWNTEDFVLSSGDDVDEDPAKRKLNLLLMAWTRYASAEEGVPLTKAEMVHDLLYSYFVQRSDGELRDDGGRMVQVHEERVLVPDRRTFDRFLGEMMGFMSFQYYEASALVELLPVWLRYLRQLGLISEGTMKRALGELGGLRRQMADLVERTLSDPQVAENLNAWSEAGK